MAEGGWARGTHMKVHHDRELGDIEDTTKCRDGSCQSSMCVAGFQRSHAEETNLSCIIRS